MKTILALSLLLTPMLHAAPQTVPLVDILRYTGTWYEVAAIPQPFEQGCSCVQAVYKTQADGRLAVENSCKRNGKTTVAHGVARIADATSNSKLRVQFPPAPEADYWIIGLDAAYQHAMVSNATGTTLWLLSRTRTLKPEIRKALLDTAAKQGIDVSAVKLMPQEGC